MPDTVKRIPDFEGRFFDISLDLLCVMGFDGYFKRLNPAWTQTLGFSIEELQSEPFIEFVHPDDRQRTLDRNSRVRGGGEARSFQNRYLCKDGSHRWLYWNAAPDLEHGVIYGVARDITRQKRAEEERKALVRRLQAALAEVRTLQRILPICSYCRRIRGDESYWQTVEEYVASHTDARFSHSICPTCYEEEVRPQLEAMEEGDPPDPV